MSGRQRTGAPGYAARSLDRGTDGDGRDGRRPGGLEPPGRGAGLYTGTPGREHPADDLGHDHGPCRRRLWGWVYALTTLEYVALRGECWITVLSLRQCRLAALFSAEALTHTSPTTAAYRSMGSGLPCAGFGHGNAGQLARPIQDFARNTEGSVAVLSRHNNHVWGLHIAAGGTLRLNEGADYERAYALLEDASANSGSAQRPALCLAEHIRAVSTGFDAAKSDAVRKHSAPTALSMAAIRYGAASSNAFNRSMTLRPSTHFAKRRRR